MRYIFVNFNKLLFYWILCYSGNVSINYLFFRFILQIDKPNESPVVLKGHNAEVTDVSWNNNDFTKVGIIALFSIKKKLQHFQKVFQNIFVR
jgi:hypothetical protein